jgi:neopullulanase
MRKLKLLFLICFTTIFFQTQATQIERVEPPFWWVDMKNPNLQLLVYGKDISYYEPSIEVPGITISRVERTENPNYLFVYLHFDSSTKHGELTISFRKGDHTLNHPWMLKERNPGSAERKGFDASDVIYLLMPDRFANGDPTNDDAEGMLEKADRKNPDGRHGGDIRGIIKQLDYLDELGITAIWHNPVFENNQKAYSYHGYAITDFYNTDARLGSMEEYLELVREADKRGIKIIKDMIFNHCGSNHWWMKDLPSGDWIHAWPEYTKTHYRGTTLVDPHVAQTDLDVMIKGWFDRNMPDLDQRNPHLAVYLIQNSIWWIEHSGIGGIRVDTQPYPYREFMADWGKRIMEEYPDFTVVGEAWMPKASLVSYYQGSALNHDGYNTSLPSVFDFPLYYAINSAFTEKPGWDTGLIRLYDILAEDFLYPDPYRLIVFGDNHDVNRLFTNLDKDLDALKLAMTFILTTRGIPSIYYGTEILKTGLEHTGHGNLRTNYPGGWPEDKKDAFSGEGLSGKQQEAFRFIQHLLNYRKITPALHNGKLTHFIPENNVYVYFRILGEKKIMVILNGNEKDQELKLARFSNMLGSSSSGREILSNAALILEESLGLKARTAMVIELD